MILLQYLEKKLNRSLAGLTYSAVGKLLAVKGVSDELQSRVQNVLYQSEMGRYAPSDLDTTSSDIVAETDAIISELDKLLSTDFDYS